MPFQKRNIGRIPVYFGDYEPGRVYKEKNRVTLYGSEFQAAKDNPLKAPLTYDSSTHQITEWNVANGEHASITGEWYIMANGTDAWYSSIQELRSTVDKKYEKPAGGIPSSDLSSAVRESLRRADESVSEENFEEFIDGLHEEYGDPTRLNQLEDWGNIADEATLRSRLRNVSDLSQSHTQRISFTVGGKTGFAIVTYNGEEFYVEYTIGSNRYACKQDANQSGGWTPWLGSTELETYEHLSNLDTRCDEQEDDILALDERKADVEGSYESMAVGSAKTLEATTLTAVDFTKRVVPSSVGSGASKLSLLKGNTLVWNQMIPMFSNSVSEITNGVTWSYDNNTGLFTFQGTCTETSSFETNFTSWTTVDIVAGHKYLVFNADRDGGNTPTLSIRVGDADTPSTIYVPNNYDLRNTIITAGPSKSSTYCVYINFKAGETYDGSCYFNIFDLTKMFGEGNEPSSVEEFEALFPRENYAYADAYNTPWLMNFKGTGLKSTGSDFEQTLPLNVTTLKGKAEGSDTEVVMFPDGLKKVEGVYDEINFKNGIAIKRVGSVDLGTLNYTFVEIDMYPYFSTLLSTIANRPKDKMNYICAKYNSISPISYENMSANTSDRIVARRLTVSGSTEMYIRDLRYTSVEDFKGDNSGVILYYELATPIVYHFEPLNNVYRVEQGGTEEVLNRDTLVPEGYNPLTAPMRADIRYGVDVVGILGNLKKDYVSKESIQVFLSAIGTQMGGTWSMTWNETAGRYDFVFTPNTVGGVVNKDNVYYLGEFSSSALGEQALAKASIAGNENIRAAWYHYKGGLTAFAENYPTGAQCRQMLHLGQAIHTRVITFTDNTRSTVSVVGGWNTMQLVSQQNWTNLMTNINSLDQRIKALEDK